MNTKPRYFFAIYTVVLFVVVAIGAGNVLATPYGVEITRNDGIGSIVGGILTEDNETEPGMIQSQAWDLEGFFLSGKSLTIAGGYNFYSGYGNTTAGDIFIDINGDAVYSPNTIPGYTYTAYSNVSNGLFKYDYVLDINWLTGTFDVVKLTKDSILKDTMYGSLYNKPSNPWMYLSGGAVVTSGSFNTYGKASRDDTGFKGMGTDLKHYVATFDISPIDLSKGAVFHTTMECGNDNLIGQAAPVPEPGTIVLLGFGLAGLAVYGRRRMK